MIDLTILIVNWNTKDLLEATLNSVGAYQGPLKLETIVIDNGSEDGSVERVKEKFPNVAVVANQSNLGFAQAVNQGIQKGEGRAFLLLNSDARLLPGTLDQLFQVLFSQPHIGAVGAELVNEDGSLQNAVDHFPNLVTELLNKSLLKMLFPKLYPGKRSGFIQPTSVPVLIGAALMVRRDMVEEVGLLDEDYFFFMEETDWCYRMRQYGWERLFVPGAKVEHLQGQTVKKNYLKAKVEYYRSRYLFFKKHKHPLSSFVLKRGLEVKIGLNLICATFLKGFTSNKKNQTRYQKYHTLFQWHLKKCPADMGLKNHD